MRSWILLQQISHQLRRVRDERDHLVVRHSGRTNDSNYSSQRTCVIRSCHDREVRELRIVVLIPNGYRNSAGVATTTKQLAEFLPRFGQLDKSTHVVNTGELRLLSQHRRLAQHHSILVRFERAIENLIALFDEDVEQISRVALNRVAQAIAEGSANLAQRQASQSFVEDARDFGDGGIGDLTAHIDENGSNRARRKSERDEQSLRRKSNELDSLEHCIVETRTERNAKLLGDDAETLRGTSQNCFDS